MITWAVTIAGFALTARYAVKGWKVAARTAVDAQEHRKKLDDDADREVFLDMLAESLRYWLWQLPFFIRQVEKDGVIGAGQFVHMDAAREEYDRNRERLVLVQDEAMRRRIGRWFYGARIWRATLEWNYMERPAKEGRVIIGVVKWGLTASLNHALKEAKAIYEELGFPKKYPGEEAYEALKRAEEEADTKTPEAK